MEPVREAGRALARRREVLITQRGAVLDPDAPFRGPVRFRLRPVDAPASAPTAEAAPPNEARRTRRRAERPPPGDSRPRRKARRGETTATS